MARHCSTRRCEPRPWPASVAASHEGVRVHSLRLPDLQPTGWHEVIFTGGQEMLTIRHDDWGYEAYAVTVAQAVRKVMEPGVVGLIRGYDAVIGLK
jgi:dihydrodipicolinate reductase